MTNSSQNGQNSTIGDNINVFYGSLSSTLDVGLYLWPFILLCRRECKEEAEVLDAAVSSVAIALLEESLAECVKSTAEDLLSEAWKEKMDHLEELRVHFEWKQLTKYWRR